MHEWPLFTARLNVARTLSSYLNEELSSPQLCALLLGSYARVFVHDVPMHVYLEQTAGLCCHCPREPEEAGATTVPDVAWGRQLFGPV
jgi:hypothetical protein